MRQARGASLPWSPPPKRPVKAITSSDLWALGCILYQIIAGRFAFQGLSEYLTWQKVKQLDYSFPEGFDEQAKDLVCKLLVREMHLAYLHRQSTSCRCAIQPSG